MSLRKRPVSANDVAGRVVDAPGLGPGGACVASAVTAGVTEATSPDVPDAAGEGAVAAVTGSPPAAPGQGKHACEQRAAHADAGPLAGVAESPGFHVHLGFLPAAVW